MDRKSVKMTRNSKISLFAIIPAFVLCLLARFMQIVGTDFRIGSLYDDVSFIADYGFAILLVLTFAAVILLARLDRKNGAALYQNNIRETMVDMKAVAVGFPLLVAGAMAAYEGFMQTKALVPSAFLMFVDFVLGGAMAILGFIILYKKEITSLLGFCVIVPALYYTLRGIGVFMGRMAIFTIPEYLIEALTIIGMGVFFMLLAKLLSGNEGKRTRTALCAVGVVTAVMTLANAFAVMIVDIFGIQNAEGFNLADRIVENSVEAAKFKQALISKFIFTDIGDHGYYMAYTSWVDVVMAVGIVLILIALYKKNKPVEPDAEAAEISEAADENE